MLPVRACMSANVTLRFVLLYGVPGPVLEQAAADVTAALADGALTGLPVHRFALDRHRRRACSGERREGKVLVIPDKSGGGRP